MLSLVYFKIVNVFSILNMYQKNTKKGTEKNMEKFKVEGVTFYYESQKYYASKCDIKDIDIDDNAFKSIEAIIHSMTPAERSNPEILNGSRRTRIAKGSGTTIQEVNRLLKQFDQTRKMMKMVTGSKMGKMMPKMKR